MSTAHTPDPATRREPPTLEELRLKLAQYVVDAQRAELQQHIGQLPNAGTERDAKGARARSPTPGLAARNRAPQH